MINSLLVLLLCQLAGEALARGIGLPVPGPVIGMALLMALLAARDALGRSLAAELRDIPVETTAKELLGILSLLFVPAGVGVVDRLSLFANHGLALTVALVVSTVLALAAAALTFDVVARWVDRPERAR